ncbi:MAG: L,D-transpeptidase [Verrucomicrobiota bacterium]|nr:L,D-transpeptidase [Verrucomicrobiota bacterium]
MFRTFALVLSSLLLLRTLHADGGPVVNNEVIVSVKEQKLMLLQNGARVTTYPVSTSKFGLGDSSGRMTTPIGAMAVAQKIGDHAPVGAVFHNRRFTGEILKPNAPGRDPIVSRIIWLRGLEASTAHAFSRCIYIHGTAEERTIGRPASFGCIRMKSKDVVDLYSQLPLGAVVRVVPDKLPKVAKAKTIYRIQAPDAPQEVGRPPAVAGSQDTAPPPPKNASAVRFARNNG